MTTVKYKIFPDRRGRWYVSWFLTPAQQHASSQLLSVRPRLCGKIFYRRKNEKKILEEMCEKYATKLCEQMYKNRTDQELRTAAPLIEHGCETNGKRRHAG